MSAFYFFSKEQLQKLKLDDLLKLAGYYDVKYDKKLTDVDSVIRGILSAQENIHDYGYTAPESEPQGVSARIKRIRDSNRKEE